MTLATDDLTKLAVRLPPSERLRLVEAILASLDAPDPGIAAAWGREAEDRLAAYRRGEIPALDETDVVGPGSGR